MAAAGTRVGALGDQESLGIASAAFARERNYAVLIRRAYYVHTISVTGLYPAELT